MTSWWLGFVGELSGGERRRGSGEGLSLLTKEEARLRCVDGGCGKVGSEGRISPVEMMSRRGWRECGNGGLNTRRWYRRRGTILLVIFFFFFFSSREIESGRWPDYYWNSQSFY